MNKPYTTTFNREKALAAVQYSSKELIKGLFVVRSIYLADIYHLEHHGIRITGDTYFISEAYGHIPTNIYKELKLIRDFGYLGDGVGVSVFNSEYGMQIVPRERADIRIFSDSEIAALDYGINTCISQFNHD